VARALHPKLQKCSLCEAVYEMDSFGRRVSLIQMMKERHICFRCAFWIDKIENPSPDEIIIDGNYYDFYTYPSFHINHNKTLYILLKDNSVIASDNLVFHGKIPQRFRKNFPDTAMFISSSVYRKLKADNFKCKAKGCWDRYYCFRYDNSIEENSGPWNIIPKTHKVGDECCVSFINKNKLSK
jgi:hypothetical protein